MLQCLFELSSPGKYVQAAGVMELREDFTFSFPAAR